MPYAARLARLQSAMVESETPCLALIPGKSLIYMTGLDFHLMERAQIAFYPAEGKPVFVLPRLERSKFERNKPYDCDLFTYEDGEDPALAVKEAVGLLPKLDTIAVEALSMRVFELGLIEEQLPGFKYPDATPIIDTLKLIKDADEVGHLRSAIRISEAALEQVIASVKVGMTEREIASMLNVAQLEGGGGAEMPFAPIVLASENAADPHGASGDRVLEVGDVLLFDFGTTQGGYASDITRTFFVGREPDSKNRAVYEVVKAANEAGKKAAAPGVSCAEVDRITRQVIVDAGFGEYFVHRTGHGLGMGAHEAPSVDGANQTLLAEGNVITIEPGIYIPGEIGVRIEDDVLITADGSESLTSFDRELRIIGG